MPYILLLIGLIIGIYALSRFFLKADVEDIKALILSAITLTICAALFILSVTGRLPAAIAIVSALAPFALGHYNAKKRRKTQGSGTHGDEQNHTGSQLPMTREEALKILGLGNSADEKDIQNAYIKLMKKVHPDQEGSEWMARKLNEARDFLIGS